MEEHPLVSIITPSFNQADFLEDTIRSVLAQDYPNIEYIIIDGGSTDGTIDIIRKYESKLAYWTSQPDEGQSDAINSGFKIAKGQIVAWLNSDDIYMPNAVSTAVEYFRKNPDTTVFYGDAVIIDEHGDFVRHFHEIEPYNEFRLRNCSDFIMQPTTFFRRDKLMEVGLLNTKLHFCMDWDLWCRFAKAGCKFHYEEKVIAANREHGTTKTLSGGRRRLKEIRKMHRIHGTSIWPHSVFSYYLGYLCQLKPQSWFMRYFAVLPLKLMFCVFNYKNILHYRENFKSSVKKKAWAFFPGENILNARITFPIYRPVQLLVVCASMPLPENCKATAVAELPDGEKATTTFRGDQNVHLVLKIPSQMSDSHIIDLGLIANHGIANATKVTPFLKTILAI